MQAFFDMSWPILLIVRVNRVVFRRAAAVTQILRMFGALQGVKLYGSKLLRPKNLTASQGGVRIQDSGQSRAARSCFAAANGQAPPPVCIFLHPLFTP